MAAGGIAIAAGAVVAALAPATPTNCDKDKQKCALPVDSTGKPIAPPCTSPHNPVGCYDLASDQERAGTARTQPVMGYAIIGGGLATIAGGVVWYFLARPAFLKSDSKTVSRLALTRHRGDLRHRELLALP